MRGKLSLMVGVCVTAISSPVIAQTADDDIGFEEIIVTAQRQAQSCAITGAVDAVSASGPGPFWLQQTHIFVKTDRPGGEIKFFGEVADGVSGGHGGYCARQGRFRTGDSSVSVAPYNASDA